MLFFKPLNLVGWTCSMGNFPSPILTNWTSTILMPLVSQSSCGDLGCWATFGKMVRWQVCVCLILNWALLVVEEFLLLQLKALRCDCPAVFTGGCKFQQHPEIFIFPAYTHPHTKSHINNRNAEEVEGLQRRWCPSALQNNFVCMTTSWCAHIKLKIFDLKNIKKGCLNNNIHGEMWRGSERWKCFVNILMTWTLTNS